MSESAAGQTALAFLVICAAGCGGTTHDYPVQGQVSYRSEAITHGVLTFFSEGGRPVAAPVTREGAYFCRLPPGQYVVTLTLGVDLPAGWKEGDPIPKPAFVLPPQYTRRTKSTLTKTVTESQQNTIDFALE